MLQMVEREDWLFRPVVEGMIKGESLLDGSVDLEFIMLCNEALDVRGENGLRLRKAADHGSRQ